MHFWAHVERTSHRAADAGALYPVTTTEHVLKDQGLQFLVRQVDSNCIKDQARRQTTSPVNLPINPFLPYDQKLWLGDMGPQHVLLLNKYPVVANHVLLVTRRFATQQTVLERSDLAALAHCLRAASEPAGLAFYNGGADAGSSQPHRHLQLVPLPLSDKLSSGVPLENAILDGLPASGPGRGQLPFAHAAARWTPADDLEQTSTELYALYRRLLDELHLAPASDERVQGCRPYNLLVTRQWIMVVPRALECFDGISLNALAFVGALLVRNAQQMDHLREHGPIAALRAAAAADGRPND